MKAATKRNMATTKPRLNIGPVLFNSLVNQLGREAQEEQDGERDDRCAQQLFRTDDELTEFRDVPP